MQGINRFIFSLGYKSESIIDFAEEQYKDLDKVYVIEKEPLGTGGAIKEACKNVLGENVIILNGDTLFSIDLQELADIHTKQKAECTLALKPMTDFSRYGSVETNSNAMVTAFNEKQFRKKGLINGGNLCVECSKIFTGTFAWISFLLKKNIYEKKCSILHKLYGIAF